MTTFSRRTALGLALVTLVVGCDTKKDATGGSTAPSARATDGTPAEKKAILCLNAASTKEAMTELAAALERSSGVTVKFSPEDSSKLANQIVNGAPAHVFLSANEKWADFVKEKGFAEETKPLLGNTLVLVVPKGNPAKIGKPGDLDSAALKHLAVAGPTVPAGIYAKAALTSLKLWDDLEKNKKLAQGENVRGTLAFVEKGEAEAGIVYATDAKISGKVEVVFTFDPTSHPKIVYPLVLLKAGAMNEGAKRWFEYLQTGEAAQVFKKHGFTSLIGS